MKHRILILNPGSTSTKIAVYDDEEPIFQAHLAHSLESLSHFAHPSEQLDFRLGVILKTLEDEGLMLRFDAVMARGGLTKPVTGGIYAVNARMLHDLEHAEREHACNLGAPLAYRIAAMSGCGAYIADPGVVDELEPEARLTGSPLMPRHTIWHALNQRATARRFAAETGRCYESLNLIVCHMGGGITVAAHRHGRAIYVNNGLTGDGPFTPERSGSLPAADLIRLCFSGQYTQRQLLRRIAGEAGLAAHLGTNDVRQVVERIERGDEKARLVLDAMIYQTARQIGAQATVLCGKVDAILLTGGIAHSAYVVERLRRRIEFIAPLHVYPGEDEMHALNDNALAVLRGQRKAKIYG